MNILKFPAFAQIYPWPSLYIIVISSKIKYKYIIINSIACIVP